MEIEEKSERRLPVLLKTEEGVALGSPLDLPLTVTHAQLEALANQLLQTEEPLPCAFYVNDQEIIESLEDAIKLNSGKADGKDVITEHTLEIICQPQAVFKVRPVTRCTSSIPGHGEAITCVQFSPEGKYLASGSGDTTVRFWDVSTETPQFTCKGHSHWVLCVEWSPDGRCLASACKNGEIWVWDPTTGNHLPQAPLKGHKKWITALSWEPLHAVKGEQCRRLASASKDGDVRLWDVVLGRCTKVLAGHTAGVTCLRWGGEDLIYSASQDRTIKVWRASDGALCRTLQGHGHWVNTMALHTDYVMRCGAFDPAAEITGNTIRSLEGKSMPELVEQARQRYNEAKGPGPERMASGSDDFTIYLWSPSVDKKPIARLTGHQQLINQVRFSPDGRWIVSASFDKSVKLWCGKTGKYISSFRGHVQAIYQVAFSADSRLVVTGSADSTLKLFDVRTGKIAGDLPGHADEVYAVDWSPDGQRVVSGGKDKLLKIWRY